MKELMVKSLRQKFGLRVFPENPSRSIFKRCSKPTTKTLPRNPEYVQS